MRAWFDLKSSSIVFRVVLQIIQEHDHPVAVFPVDFAAAHHFPLGGVLVPGREGIETADRLSWLDSP